MTGALEHIRLWHARRGQLVAYALPGEEPAFDCDVAPEYDRAGLEAGALDWAETRLDALRDSHFMRAGYGRFGLAEWQPKGTHIGNDRAGRVALTKGVQIGYH